MLKYEDPVSAYMTASADSITARCSSVEPLQPGGTVKRISGEIVAKVGIGISEQEFANQSYAYERLNGYTLRVPEPYRFLMCREDDIEYGVILSEYIHGTKPQEYGERATVVDKIVNAICFMHDTTRDDMKRPGPIFGGLATGFPWAKSCAEREFDSIDDLQASLNRRLKTLRRSGRTIKLQGCACSLVHGELVPRNMMLNTDGQVVFLDWATANFYPDILETASLYHYEALSSPPESQLLRDIVDKLIDKTHVGKRDLEKIGLVHTVNYRQAFDFDESSDGQGTDDHI